MRQSQPVLEHLTDTRDEHHPTSRSEQWSAWNMTTDQEGSPTHGRGILHNKTYLVRVLAKGKCFTVIAMLGEH